MAGESYTSIDIDERRMSKFSGTYYALVHTAWETGLLEDKAKAKAFRAALPAQFKSQLPTYKELTRADRLDRLRAAECALADAEIAEEEALYLSAPAPDPEILAARRAARDAALAAKAAADADAP